MSANVHFKMDIYNSMSFTVYVVNRQNMKFKITRSTSAAKGKLIFLKGIGLSPQARYDLQHITTTDDVSNSKELSHLLDKWSKLQNSSANTITSLDQFMYTVDEEVLRAKKSIYLRDLDLTVCLEGHVESHPYSHQAQLKNRYTEVRADLRSQTRSGRRFFTWNVFIIDNAGKIGDRWINVHGLVYRVHSVSDPDSKDGFYVVRDKPVSDGTDQSTPTSDFKETEAELDFPIYRSYQEAISANQTESTVRLQLLNSEREIKEIELQTRLAKAEADADKLKDDIQQQARKNAEAERAHEREMEAIRESMKQERLKAQHEREKFEQDKAKFEHDKHTQEQKNAGESIKAIAGLLTGILGLLAIASKWLK